MRLPVATTKVIGCGTLDASEAQQRFGIARIVLVPGSPEVFERGISLSVEKGVLQAVGLVARKAVGDIHGVTRLKPLILADHGNERILLPFPSHPIVPAEVRPCDGRIARLELGLKGERMADRIGGLAKTGRDALQRIEVDSVGIDVFEQLRHDSGCATVFTAGSCIPHEQWEKDFYVVAVKLVDHLANTRNPAGKIAQHIKLIAVVDAKVGINVPDENSVNRADATLGFGEETTDSVFAFFRIVETSVPNEQLYLGKDVRGPLEIGTSVLRVVVAQKRLAIIAPRLERFAPCRRVRGRCWP